jgi:hypothetical protein
MKVVFLSPNFPLEMPHFTRGLAEVGAQVYGVGSTPLDAIAQDVRRNLHGYVHVPDLLDTPSALQHALPQLRRLQPDRVECLWEVGVELAAQLREALGVPGMSAEDVHAFRDKGVMKQRLEAAGLRVPRNARVSTRQEAFAAAERIGFPLIVKPMDGAGTRDTFRADDAAEFERVLGKVGHLPEASIEEYIDGQEFTYDTVSIDGVPVFDSIAQYHPRPLESRTLEWISPAQMVLRDPHTAGLGDAVKFGRDVLKAMGMGTGFTHMEWFRKPDGEIVFGEIAARAPGGRLVDQMNFANDFNVYREWARTVCWGRFEATAHRRYHVACVFKRALGQGRIQAIHGLEAVRQRLGPWLVAEDLLPVGSPRRDWKQTLLSDGCLIARHPDYGSALEMMRMLVNEVRIVAG